MKTSRCHLTQIIFALSLFLLFSNFVQAETINCTAITSLPYVITTQGIYCLTSDLGTSITSGQAIEIDTNNVVIDLNGHKLGGQGAGAGTRAYGIHANNRANIAVRNGTVRGFYTGIYFEGTSSSGHVVENMRLDFNKAHAINVYGNAHLIRDNQVISTGGHNNGNFYNMGIVAQNGSGVTVMNNRVIDTERFGNTALASIGIEFVYHTSFNVIGNVVANTAVVGTTGINAYDSYGIIYGNTIQNFTSGVTVEEPGASAAKCMNNLTLGTATPFLGCTDAGGNN